MIELNNRGFTVTGKSGNSFQLQNEDSTGYAAYVAGSGGNLRSTISNAIDLSLNSAAWNPWMTEGIQSQLGYIDFFIDTNQKTTMNVKFYTNNSNSPYKESTINYLPNLRERGEIANITNANPAKITSNGHDLTDGEEIYIYTVDGMNSINGGPYVITVVDENNFTIDSDSTNFSPYTTGGVITELPYQSSKAWKRIYAGGTGYQNRISIESSGKDHPLRINALMPWFKPRGRVI
jgi:hypothetical protein